MLAAFSGATLRRHQRIPSSRSGREYSQADGSSTTALHPFTLGCSQWHAKEQKKGKERERRHREFCRQRTLLRVVSIVGRGYGSVGRIPSVGIRRLQDVVTPTFSLLAGYHLGSLGYI